MELEGGGSKGELEVGEGNCLKGSVSQDFLSEELKLPR